MMKNLLSLAALSLAACSTAFAGNIYLVGSPTNWLEPSEANSNIYANWTLSETEEGSQVYTGKFNVEAGTQFMRFYQELDGWDAASSIAPSAYDTIGYEFQDGTFHAPAMSGGYGCYSFNWNGGDLYIKVDLNYSIATFSDKEIAPEASKSIYLIGDMTNWDRSDTSYFLMETEAGSNVYEGTYYISGPKLCFKVMETPNCDWSDLLCSTDEDFILNYTVFGKDGIYTNKYMLPAGGEEKAWQWDEWRGGTLKFTVDQNNETLTLHYLDFFGLPEKLYLIGAPQDWDITNGNLTLEPDVENPYIYKGSFYIPESAFMFRFYKELNDWESGSMGAAIGSYNVMFKDGFYSGDCEQGDLNFRHTSWPGGDVAITVDLANYSVMFDAGEYSDPDTTDDGNVVYLVGSPGGWMSPDVSNADKYKDWALLKVSEGVYENTFYIQTGAALFRFYTALTGWDGGDSYGSQWDDNPIQYWFDDSNAFTTDLMKGKGSYWFPDWTDDNMTITVDFNYGIVTMVKGSTGIESVDAADVEKEYYRLDGTRVMGMPEKGFYIVREGNKVTKMIR